jgi:hypothetical protein
MHEERARPEGSGQKEIVYVRAQRKEIRSETEEHKEK